LLCEAVGFSVPVDDGFKVADFLVAAGAAADDRDRIVVVVMVLFGRRSSSARRRNILVGAMIYVSYAKEVNQSETR
jgi:hypothetical protein